MVIIREPMVLANCVFMSVLVVFGVSLLNATPIAFFFPFHCMYYVLNYLCLYPQAHFLRVLAFTSLLSFVDLIFSDTIVGVHPKDLFSLLFVEYLLVFPLFFVICRKLDAGHTIGSFIYVVYVFEGFFAAELLSGSIQKFTDATMDLTLLACAFLFGGVKLLIEPCISLVDGILCLPVPMRRLDYSGFALHRRGLTVFLLIAILLAVYAHDTLADDVFNKEMTISQGAFDVAFASFLLYTLRSLE